MTAFTINIRLDDALAEDERPSPDALTLMETAVTTTLKQQKIEAADLTIFLTDDQHSQQLNREYLGKDKPTDVLSFPAGEPMPGMQEFNHYLGDIIIAIPYSTRQAATSGHDLEAELQLLAVHGALHLLGYDHADSAEKAKMWQAQTAVLTKLGLAQIKPTET